jgi:hypothetical protein
VSIFKRCRFPVEIILLCVRWYCKYGSATAIMQERVVNGDPSTIFRWVERCAPEIEKRVRLSPVCQPTTKFLLHRGFAAPSCTVLHKDQRVTHAAFTENKRLGDVLAYIKERQDQRPPPKIKINSEKTGYKSRVQNRAARRT